MAKYTSIGDILNAAVEALLRDEQPTQLQDLPADAAKRIADVHRVVAEREANDRADQRHRQAVDMKDPANGKFPAHAVNAALASWPAETSAMRHAREYLASRKRVIVLAGGVGAGKTTAAGWIALEAGGSAPGFIRASSLERRGRYSKGLDTWLDARSSLVIDDLGAELLDGHGVFRSLLDEVIDTFYGSERRVIITTNLRQRRSSPAEQEQFVERYGERVASRLSEIGLWSDCGARDLRRDQLKLASGGQR